LVENVSKDIPALRSAIDHRTSVGRALAEGKPVPAEVLAEYPDLAPQGLAAPLAEPAVPPAPAPPAAPTVPISSAERKLLWIDAVSGMKNASNEGTSRDYEKSLLDKGWRPSDVDAVTRAVLTEKAIGLQTVHGMISEAPPSGFMRGAEKGAQSEPPAGAVRRFLTEQEGSRKFPWWFQVLDQPRNPFDAAAPELKRAYALNASSSRSAQERLKALGSLSVRDALEVAVWDTKAPVTRRLAAAEKLGLYASRDALTKIHADGYREYVDSLLRRNLPTLTGDLDLNQQNDLSFFLHAVRAQEIRTTGGKESWQTTEGLEDAQIQQVIDTLGTQDFWTRGQVVWDLAAKVRKKLLDSGLVSRQSFDALAAKGQHYLPQELIHHLEAPSAGLSGLSAEGAGLATLTAEGSPGQRSGDLPKLLEEMLNKTYGAASRNGVRQGLYRTAEDLGATVAVADWLSLPRQQDPKPGQQPPSNYAQESVFVNGKPKTMWIEQERPGFTRLQAWFDGEPSSFFMQTKFAVPFFDNPDLFARHPALATALEVLTGVKGVKTLATGTSTTFALGNVPRDASHVFFSIPEAYSANPVEAANQMREDVGQVLRPSVRAILAERFLSSGGRFAGFTSLGKLGTFDWKPRRPTVAEAGPAKALAAEGAHQLLEGGRAVQNGLAYLGEHSETTMRLAPFKRLLDKGYTPEQAAALVNQAMPFHEGGYLSKTLDHAIAYLNAGTVAMRGLSRGIAREPVRAMEATAYTMAGAYLLYELNHQSAHSTAGYAQIDETTKQNYWVLVPPLPPFAGKDKKSGGTIDRYLYFAIPKDQAIRPLATALDLTLRKANGETIRWPELLAAPLRELIPGIQSSGLPPAANALLALAYNKDTFFNDEPWQWGYPVSPWARYYSSTPEWAKSTGKALNLGPENLVAAKDALLPPSNPIVQGRNNLMFSNPSMQRAGGVPEAERNSWPEALLGDPHIKRFVKMTYPEYRNMDAAQQTMEEWGAKRKVATDSYWEAGSPERRAQVRRERPDYKQTFDRIDRSRTRSGSVDPVLNRQLESTSSMDVLAKADYVAKLEAQYVGDAYLFQQEHTRKQTAESQEAAERARRKLEDFRNAVTLWFGATPASAKQDWGQRRFRSQAFGTALRAQERRYAAELKREIEANQ